jgi:hypothetical protein
MTNEYWTRLFTRQELNDMREDSRILNKEEYNYIESNVIWFVNRLYFSNQIAYYRTYEKDKSISFDQLSSGAVLTSPYSTKELLNILRDVRYNISDNCGHTFLPVRDVERLDQIIEYVAFELVQYIEA